MAASVRVVCVVCVVCACVVSRAGAFEHLHHPRHYPRTPRYPDATHTDTHISTPHTARAHIRTTHQCTDSHSRTRVAAPPFTRCDWHRCCSVFRSHFLILAACTLRRTGEFRVSPVAATATVTLPQPSPNGGVRAAVAAAIDDAHAAAIDSGRALMRLAGPDAGRGAVASPLGHPSIVTSVQDADSVITARRSQSGRL